MLNRSNWLSEYDPYGIMQVVLYKALVMATVLVFVYWAFRPESFLSFVAPTLIVSYYELLSLESFREKERALWYIFGFLWVGSATFYLIYPFRVTFLFYAILYFSVLYFVTLRFFPKIRNAIMLITSTSILYVSIQPPANLQVMYGFLSSSALSMLTIWLCLHFAPNYYHKIWCRAAEKYLSCLADDIAASFEAERPGQFSSEVNHIDVMRAYRRMISKKYLVHISRISYQVRNMHFALDNLYYQDKDKAYWLAVKDGVSALRCAMNQSVECPKPFISATPKTEIQNKVSQYFYKAVIHWNQLCKML